MAKPPKDETEKELLLDLRKRIVDKFGQSDWEELGFRTDTTDIINGHHRLLRSLSWGDEDYAGNVLNVLVQMGARDPRLIPRVQEYVDTTYPSEDALFVSAKASVRKITFAPTVFDVPDGYVEPDLVAVMMPFEAKFDPVIKAIRDACESHRLRCLRADDIWEESVLMQDIFNLIFRAQVVIVDFTGKNPNVMYETGIAHTLGKHVIPITQSIDDVPFDTKHHRAATYLHNTEGLAALRARLKDKLKQFAIPDPPPPKRPADGDFGQPPAEDDFPF